MHCPNCGKDVAAGAQFCGHCGAVIPPQGPQLGGPAAAVGPTSTGPGRFAHLPEYWQSVFRRFDQEPTRMQTHWNLSTILN